MSDNLGRAAQSGQIPVWNTLWNFAYKLHSGFQTGMRSTSLRPLN